MLGVFGLAVGPWMQESGDSAFRLFVVSRLLGSTWPSRSERFQGSSSLDAGSEGNLWNVPCWNRRLRQRLG